MDNSESMQHKRLVTLTRWFINESENTSTKLGINREDLTDQVLDDASNHELFKLFRSLVNIRTAHPVPDEVLSAQDTFLKAEIDRKGITDARKLHGPTLQKKGPELIMWQGDITTLKVDAIVNAANSALLGCWAPCHGCIDNAIHTFSGIQLRAECQRLMDAQGHDEETGKAKITGAYNLPSRYVVHTVGPIIHNRLRAQDEKLLSECYQACLTLAEENHCGSIAFCCISTGEFHFPNQRAAEIAVEAVKRFSMDRQPQSVTKIIFNVFKDIDRDIYARLLQVV